MNARKVMAVTLAAAMVAGSSMTVFADSDSTTGSGEMEGYVSTKAFSVLLPTIAEDDATFNFIMDPQGLIDKTDKARYGDSAEFEDDATLYFASGTTSTTDDGGNTTTVTNYTSYSATLDVINKSSVDVDITVAATLSDYGDVVVTSDSTFEGDEDASLYLALVGKDAVSTTTTDDDGSTLTSYGDDTVAFTVDEDNGTVTATLSGTISAADDAAYDYTWDANTGYAYTIVDEEDDDGNSYFDTYSFYMTGATNESGDWTAINSAGTTPTVDVVWTVENPIASAPTFTATSTGLTYTTGSGDAALASITSITMTNSYGAFDGYNANGNLYAAATDDGSTITFASAYISYYTDTTNGYTATVVYVNAAGDSVTTTVAEVFKAE